MSKNPKNWWKSMKIANITEKFFISSERLEEFQFSRKMWLMIILKVLKKHGFTLFLEDTFFEKPRKESNWPPALLGLRLIP